MYIAFKKKPKRKGVSLWVYVFLLLAAATAYSFVNPPEKKYKVEMTLNDFIKGSKWMDIAKNALERSDLPSKDVTIIKDSLNAFQNQIILQVNSQLEADKKLEKPKTDSSSKKQ